MGSAVEGVAEASWAGTGIVVVDKKRHEGGRREKGAVWGFGCMGKALEKSSPDAIVMFCRDHSCKCSEDNPPPPSPIPHSPPPTKKYYNPPPSTVTPTPPPPKVHYNPPLQSSAASPTSEKCPVDALKLGVCVNLLGGLVKISLGDPHTECCPLLKDIVELGAAACLCTTIRASVHKLNLILPVALDVFAQCSMKPPPGFTCPANS
ncbi:hypothetical protein KI387_026022 [Taxus chinensis]|uniref:Bifunctional inhibitor/plant lipid transfer protein/seed storage helical domain-containing protein n=1 Tax=Taxus chinensis TaxID=29808 RepID=A0AA38L861_TAXCH|nr:hypothetical protein KI387_026022 [Taxus chinensis]